MTAYTLTPSTTDTTCVMVGKDAKGVMVTEEVNGEKRRALYAVPPTGEYELEVTRFAEPFEMEIPPDFRRGDETTATKTRLEFVILKGPGKGRKFTDLYTWTVGPKSNMGRLFGKARGKEIAKGEPFDLFEDGLGMRFRAYVTQSEVKDENGKPKYAKVGIETVQPIGATAPSEAEWPED